MLRFRLRGLSIALLIVTGPLLTAIMSAGTVLGVGMLILLMIRDYRSLEELSS